MYFGALGILGLGMLEEFRGFRELGASAVGLLRISDASGFTV